MRQFLKEFASTRSTSGCVLIFVWVFTLTIGCDRKSTEVHEAKSFLQSNEYSHPTSAIATSQSGRTVSQTLTQAENRRLVFSILNSISNDFKSQELVGNSNAVHQWSPQDMAVAQLINKLGYISETNDDAMRFLRSGADPAFWKGVVNWRSTMEPNNFAMLAGVCIHSIGICGRSNTLSELREMRYGNLEGPAADGSPGRLIDGELVDAAFYASTLQKRGRPALENILQSHSLREIQEWMNTPEGREWHNWSKSFTQEKQGTQKERR